MATTKTTKGPEAIRLPAFTDDSPSWATKLEQRLAAMELEIAELKATPRPRVVFGADDAHFLTWVLGFTAGANLERDGERGERIFARCRALQEKLGPVGVETNAS